MIITYTGKLFDYENISPNSINITDIIHSLAHTNRYLGHTKRPYSVAEHTYRGLKIAKKLGYTPLQKLHWLKHDFTEAYVGDCPTPLKRLLPEFSVIEKKIEESIEEYFNLKPMTEEENLLVKRLDNTMLILEMKYLTKHDYNEYICDLTYCDEITTSERLRDVYTPNELKDILIKELYSIVNEVKKNDTLNTYEIEASIQTDNYKTHKAKVQYKTMEEAQKYAESFARGLYYFNPVIDIMEYMMIANVDYERAEELFNKDLEKNVLYSVKKMPMDEY